MWRILMINLVILPNILLAAPAPMPPPDNPDGPLRNIPPADTLRKSLTLPSSAHAIERREFHSVTDVLIKSIQVSGPDGMPAPDNPAGPKVPPVRPVEINLDGMPAPDNPSGPANQQSPPPSVQSLIGLDGMPAPDNPDGPPPLGPTPGTLPPSLLEGPDGLQERTRMEDGALWLPASSRPELLA